MKENTFAAFSFLRLWRYVKFRLKGSYIFTFLLYCPPPLKKKGRSILSDNSHFWFFFFSIFLFLSIYLFRFSEKNIFKLAPSVFVTNVLNIFCGRSFLSLLVWIANPFCKRLFRHIYICLTPTHLSFKLRALSYSSSKRQPHLRLRASTTIMDSFVYPSSFTRFGSIRDMFFTHISKVPLAETWKQTSLLIFTEYLDNSQVCCFVLFIKSGCGLWNNC